MIWRRTKDSLRMSLSLAVRTYRHAVSADVQILAGSLSFTTVLSLVPLLAVSLSVFSALGGLESLMGKLEPFLLQNLVEDSGMEIRNVIHHSIDRVHSGALGIGGVVGLLFTSTKLFHDIETAVQRVWRLEIKRHLAARIAFYWVIMFAAPLLLAALLGLVGSKDLGLLKVFPKGIFALVFGFAGFLVIYKWVPARKVSWFASVGAAVFATLGIGIAQSFYRTLTTKILNYNKIYGSLASVPISLLWILVVWWICLLGVALSVVLEERRESICRTRNS
jgi:membrane protein